MASKKKRVNQSTADTSLLETKGVGASQNKPTANDVPDGEEAMETDQVQVDFEARNPDDGDFHGMKKLLQQLFLKANVNLSEMTDTLIGQNYVGSVIKQVPLDEEESDEDSDDGDDVFGLISLLPLSTKAPQKETAASDVRKFLLDKCQSCARGQMDALRKMLQDQRVGLVLNERFINIPPEIALPSFESLWKEVERAKKKGMDGFDCTHYVMICKMLRMAPLAAPGGSNKKQSAKRDTWESVYVNAEEEIFSDEADFQFDFSVASERDLSSESEDMEPWRRVLIISAEKVPVVMSKLHTLLAQT